MKYSEAIKKKNMSTKELAEMNRLMASSKMAPLSLSPILVEKEFNRLSDEIGDAIFSMTPPMQPDDVRIPIEGESMLSKIPAEFGLSSAEATERFKLTLSSELEQLMKSDVPFPFTSELIQKVIDHAEAFLKKQRLHERAVFGPKDEQIAEMSYGDAGEKREWLEAELKQIKSCARARAVNLSYLPKLLYSEYDRLSHCMGDGVMEMEYSLDEIRIPVEGVSMMARLPAEYELVSASDTEKFMQKLHNELQWAMSLGEEFPVTFEFIQRVIGYAGTYIKEKRPFEVAVFGRYEFSNGSSSEASSSANFCISQSPNSRSKINK